VRFEVSGSKFLINDKPFYFTGFGKHEDTAIRGKGHDLVVDQELRPADLDSTHTRSYAVSVDGLAAGIHNAIRLSRSRSLLLTRMESLLQIPLELRVPSRSTQSVEGLVVDQELRPADPDSAHTRSYAVGVDDLAAGID
jgi:microcompartment protein CcmK/EutM